jgi:hypothetical protein
MLGVTSLVLSGTTVLFVVLPCFWFLALPLSGLAVMLGIVGLIASAVRGEGQWGLPLMGMLAGFVLLALSGFLVLWFKVNLHHALDILRRL